MLTPKEVADGLMGIAARRSVESPFGWTCPDCEVLQEAARMVRGEPVKIADPNPEVVLSAEQFGICPDCGAVEPDWNAARANDEQRRLGWD